MAEEQVPNAERASADDAAFAASFDKERGTPPPEAKPATEAKTEPAVEAAKEPEKVVDPWEGVSPTVRTKLESIDTRLSGVDKLPDRLRNIEGHIGGLTSQLKTALAAAKAVEKTGADAPTQAQVEQAVTSLAKWNLTKGDFPDWAEAVEERLAAERAAFPKPPAPIDLTALRAEIAAEAQASQQKSDEATLKKAEEFALVRFVHRDWRTTINTPQFKAWRDKQAPDIKALADSAVADDAIRMLDAFKADSKKQLEATAKAAANAERLKRAAAPQGVPAPAAATINDEDAFTGGFEKVRSG